MADPNFNVQENSTIGLTLGGPQIPIGLKHTLAINSSTISIYDRLCDFRYHPIQNGTVHQGILERSIKGLSHEFVGEPTPNYQANHVFVRNEVVMDQHFPFLKTKQRFG
jgi:hypothetical protein